MRTFLVYCRAWRRPRQRCVNITVCWK